MSPIAFLKFELLANVCAGVPPPRFLALVCGPCLHFESGWVSLGVSERSVVSVVFHAARAPGDRSSDTPSGLLNKTGFRNNAHILRQYGVVFMWQTEVEQAPTPPPHRLVAWRRVPPAPRGARHRPSPANQQEPRTGAALQPPDGAPHPAGGPVGIPQQNL